MPDATASIGVQGAQTNSALLPVAVVGTMLLAAASLLGASAVAVALSAYAAMTGVVLLRVRAFHPYPSFGAANLITLTRGAMVAMLIPIVADAEHGDRGALIIFCLAAAVLVFDGLDGWLARRFRTVSRFGARFDMEVDALLIMVLACFAWLEDKAGAWVLLLGLMRYAFVAAGHFFPKLSADLPPSTRRKVVCVVQIVVLAAVALPMIRPPLSDILALGALALLAWSFLVDTLRLLRAKPPT